MAYYFLFPESDTTIYSHPNRKEMNTGVDEILEVVIAVLITVGFLFNIVRVVL